MLKQQKINMIKGFKEIKMQDDLKEKDIKMQTI